MHQNRPDPQVRRAPFPLLSVLPLELHDVILDFHWDQALLRRLDLPVVELLVAELEWHLDLPFWAHEGDPFRVSPSQVAADPELYKVQHADVPAPVRRRNAVITGKSWSGSARAYGGRRRGQLIGVYSLDLPVAPDH